MTKTFEGPYIKFVHGKIDAVYYGSKCSNLNFMVFGYLEMSNIRIPEGIISADGKYTKIVCNAVIKFSNGLTINNILCDAMVFKDNIDIYPRVQSIWHNIIMNPKFNDYIKSLKSKAIINQAIYSKVTTDTNFCKQLSFLNIPKEISMYELFNNKKVHQWYKWKHSIGFVFNDLVMYYELAGRKAEEELTKEYIESEKVYRTDCLRDKIDDAKILMTKNGELSERQFLLFYKYKCQC